MSDLKTPAQQSSGDDHFEVITPTDFQPAAATTSRGIGGVSWWTVGSFALLGLVAGCALYLFTARSVLIDIAPAPESMELDGALLFPLKLGERWLLHPGGYTVEATLEGYHPLSSDFAVLSEDGQQFAFTMNKLPGLLSVTAGDVPGAHVWVDGQPLSPAPLSQHELEPGTYQLTVRAPRYRDFDQAIEIEGKQIEQTVAAVLEPAWADVQLPSTPAGATLYVDGDPVGETPLTAQILEGDRDLSLQLEGYKDWATGLTLTAGAELALPTVELPPADTLVTVASTPSGASVTVEGEYRGQTPLRLALARELVRHVGGQEAAAELSAQPWPGNVRQLRNVLERAVIVSRGRQLELNLPDATATPVRTEAPRPEEAPRYRTEAEMRELERANLVAALTAASWRVSGPAGAAKLLGIKPTTLNSRLRAMNVDVPALRRGRPAVAESADAGPGGEGAESP